LKVHGWNDRKRKFSTRQIKLALDVLSRKGWCGSPSGAEA